MSKKIFEKNFKKFATIFPRFLKTFKNYLSYTRPNINHFLFSYKKKKKYLKKDFDPRRSSCSKGDRFRRQRPAGFTPVSGLSRLSPLSPELRKKQISLRKGRVHTRLRYRTLRASLLFRTKWHTYVPLYSEHSWKSQTATYRKAVLFWRVGFPYPSVSPRRATRHEDESLN